MLRIIVLTVLVLGGALTGTSATALTLDAAETCANRLLAHYNNRTYPGELIDEPAITARVYGPVYRTLRDDERAIADAAAAQVLRESFVNPSGSYEYRNLEVRFVERTRKGDHRVTGTVYITSPKYVGTASFLALSRGSGCLIFQVRVADIYSLDAQVRALLQNERAVRQLLH